MPDREDDDQPVPEQIREAIQASDYPELSIRECASRAGLSEQQVASTAGSMARLELDRGVGVVRLPEDDGGEFSDDPARGLRTDGGTSTDGTGRSEGLVERMNEYREVRENARQLRQNALELDDLVDEMQWVAAGGLGAHDPERFDRLVTASRRICEALEAMDVADPWEVRDD